MVALATARESAAAPSIHGNVVRAAYVTTVGQKTVRFALTETVHAKSAAGSTEAATVTGDGEADISTHDFAIDVNSPSGGAVRVLQLGPLTYTRVPPAQQSQIPGHKPWVSINLNQVTEAKLGKSFSQLESTENDSPNNLLANLGQVSSRVTKVGTATVNGVATTEYLAEVDLDKVAAKQKAKLGAKAAEQVQQQEQALGTRTLPVRVWIDSHSLIRRLIEQVPIPAASAGATNGSGTATLTMNFLSYGVPLSLSPPPKAQVADITALIVQQTKAAAS